MMCACEICLRKQLVVLLNRLHAKMATQGEAVQECSTLEKKIIRQVEFYFGDKNLPRDKFLQEQVKKDEEGWVTITVLTTFNRLKQLSSDVQIIADALKKSTSGLLEVSEDNTKVRRSLLQPLKPKEEMSSEEEDSRTVYVKGFPEGTTLDDLEEFFDPFGQVLLIKRKSKGVNKFMGSVFVEFKVRGDAEKLFQAQDLKYKDRDIVREWKKDYTERKEKEKKAGKSPVAASKGKQVPEDDKETDEDLKKPLFPSGTIVKFQGCAPDASVTKIKEFFQEYAAVAYVEYTNGDTKGFVRFQAVEEAKAAIEGVKAAAEGGKVLICGAESELTVLEGDEEKEYQRRAAEAARQKKAKAKHHKFGKAKQYGRKRGAKPSTDEDKGEDGPPSSKQGKED